MISLPWNVTNGRRKMTTLREFWRGRPLMKLQNSRSAITCKTDQKMSEHGEVNPADQS